MNSPLEYSGSTALFSSLEWSRSCGLPASKKHQNNSDSRFDLSIKTSNQGDFQCQRKQATNGFKQNHVRTEGHCQG